MHEFEKMLIDTNKSIQGLIICGHFFHSCIRGFFQIIIRKGILVVHPDKTLTHD